MCLASEARHLELVIFGEIEANVFLILPLLYEFKEFSLLISELQPWTNWACDLDYVQSKIDISVPQVDWLVLFSRVYVPRDVMNRKCRLNSWNQIVPLINHLCEGQTKGFLAGHIKK